LSPDLFCIFCFVS